MVARAKAAAVRCAEQVAAAIASKDSRWDVTLRFAGTLAHYTGIGDSVLDMRISSVLLFLFANAAKKYELAQVVSDATPVARDIVCSNLGKTTTSLQTLKV